MSNKMTTETFPNGTKRFSEIKAGDHFSYTNANSAAVVYTATTSAVRAKRLGHFTVAYSQTDGAPIISTQDGGIEVTIHSPVAAAEPAPVAHACDGIGHPGHCQHASHKPAEPTERTWEPTSKEAQLLAQARAQVARSDRDLIRWTTRFTVDPFQALGSADSIYEATAARQAALAVVEGLTRPASKAHFETIREYAMDKVLNKATSPEHSSGQTSNLMERYALKAWAQILENMKWI